MIDGASTLDPHPFLRLYIVVEKMSGYLAGIMTVFHSHQRFDLYRARLSQIFVFPHYMRKGIAT